MSANRLQLTSPDGANGMPPLPTKKNGRLLASILSVYDLPTSEPPRAVSLTTCGVTVTSGPPVARHKDKNSFRFRATPTSTNGSSVLSIGTATSSTGGSRPHDLQIKVPLADLYQSKVTVKVLYEDPSKTMTTEYSLNKLIIHQSTWHILPLREEGQAPFSTTMDEMDLKDNMQPTIRMKMQLDGPYRPEIAALVSIAKAWTGLVDSADDKVQGTVAKVHDSLPDKKFFLIPAVPIMTVAVVVSPVIAGVAVVALPFLVPVLAILLSIGVGVVCGGGILLASTKGGRQHLGGVFGPYFEGIISSRVGQKLVYETGPRPNPVVITKQLVPTGIWSKLFLCLLIDLIGSASYIVPVVGEAADIAWAPIQVNKNDTLWYSLAYILELT
jgi:hypothetical protein